MFLTYNEVNENNITFKFNKCYCVYDFCVLPKCMFSSLYLRLTFSFIFYETFNKSIFFNTSTKTSCEYFIKKKHTCYTVNDICYKSYDAS